MSKETIPAGVKTFPKREGSPDFILGDLILNPNDFFQWCKQNEEHLSEYTDKNGKTHKQLKFQIKNGDYGVYLELNTWKPESNKTQTKKQINPVEQDDDLPF
jgi:uncharacterized NAD(P)/FAD-binding protein YdhS